MLTSKLGKDIMSMTSKLGMEGIMQKEEILEMSRKENKNNDLVEQEIYKTASFVGTIVGWITIAFVLILTGIVQHKPNYGALFIFYAIESGIFITKYVKLKKTHELIVSILYCAAAIGTGVLFVLSTIGVI